MSRPGRGRSASAADTDARDVPRADVPVGVERAGHHEARGAGHVDSEVPHGVIGCTVDHRERGAGSVLVLTGFSVLLVLGVLAVALVAAQALHTRAASAADLAALAAASAVLSGPEIACARAAEVAAANGARLEACRLTVTDAWVEVGAPTPEALRRILRAPSEATARAHAELVVGRGP